MASALIRKVNVGARLALVARGGVVVLTILERMELDAKTSARVHILPVLGRFKLRLTLLVVIGTPSTRNAAFWVEILAW